MAKKGLLINYDYCTGCHDLRGGLQAGARATPPAAGASW